MDGTQERVGISYKRLPGDVGRGDTLLLDDGRIELWVEDVQGQEIRTRGPPGRRLAQQERDQPQGRWLVGRRPDRARTGWISRRPRKCMSTIWPFRFPRSADDVTEARELFREAGGHGDIVAKIERAEAVDALEEISTPRTRS